MRCWVYPGVQIRFSFLLSIPRERVEIAEDGEESGFYVAACVCREILPVEQHFFPSQAQELYWYVQKYTSAVVYARYNREEKNIRIRSWSQKQLDIHTRMYVSYAWGSEQWIEAKARARMLRVLLGLPIAVSLVGLARVYWAPACARCPERRRDTVGHVCRQQINENKVKIEAEDRSRRRREQIPREYSYSSSSVRLLLLLPVVVVVAMLWRRREELGAASGGGFDFNLYNSGFGLNLEDRFTPTDGEDVGTDKDDDRGGRRKWRRWEEAEERET